MKIDIIDIASDNVPLNLTDLCDDVLLEIFSNLTMDDAIRLPLVCKRFCCFIKQNKISISSISSTELEIMRSSKRTLHYDRIFEKLGSHLKNFTIDPDVDGFEMNLMLKSVRKCCPFLKSLHIHLLYANAMKNLPNSVHSLTVGDFRAGCFNVSDLIHLKTLSLTSSYTLDEIKLHHQLERFHLKLELNHMPDYVKINGLTAMTSSAKFDVEVHVRFSYATAVTIALNLLNKIANLKLFTVYSFNATVNGINATNIREATMSCHCGHCVPLSIDTLNKLLNNYRGPDSVPATTMVSYAPGRRLAIEFESDDAKDRYKYFERLRLGLPNCSCAAVDVRILLK